MKLRALSREQMTALVDEVRAMADLPAGANPDALRRAKEIRFQLQGQPEASPAAIEKADEVYRELEILLHGHRWQREYQLDHLRVRIKSACERMRVHLGLASRPPA